MSYDYQKERAGLFDAEGQADLIRAKNWIDMAIKNSGAFSMGAFLSKSGITGDTWRTMAIVDRLVELGELYEMTSQKVPGQLRIFIKN